MKALSTSVRMLAAHLCFTAPCTLALMLGIPAVKDCIQVRGEASAVPFIGQIRDVEARSSGKRREVHVLVAWFYRPEEAQGGRKARPAFAVLPARLQPGGMGGARRAPRRSAGRPAPRALAADAARAPPGVPRREGAVQVGAPGLVHGNHNRGPVPGAQPARLPGARGPQLGSSARWRPGGQSDPPIRDAGAGAEEGGADRLLHALHVQGARC